MTRIVNISTGAAWDVKIDRGTKWGNPYTVEEYGRTEALRLYGIYLDKMIKEGKLNPQELRNMVLGCWCKPKGCHGDILIKRIHQYDDKRNLLEIV